MADFRKVREDLGTGGRSGETGNKMVTGMGIDLCMDFVMNHTSEEHEWAVRARRGEGEYMSRYFFYDNPDIPNSLSVRFRRYSRRRSPGNFTWIPEIGHYVMTTFYPYQWDLNYGNPRVFNEMMYNFPVLRKSGNGYYSY